MRPPARREGLLLATRSEAHPLLLVHTGDDE